MPELSSAAFFTIGYVVSTVDNRAVSKINSCTVGLFNDNLTLPFIWHIKQIFREMFVRNRLKHLYYLIIEVQLISSLMEKSAAKVCTFMVLILHLST